MDTRETGYIEQLVLNREDRRMQFLSVFLIVLGIASLIILLPISLLFLLFTVLCFVGAYLASSRQVVEYEYLYFDKEISIDRILNRARRKKVGAYTLDLMEIVAPEHSHTLDPYRETKGKVIDCRGSSDEEGARNYIAVLTNQEKLLFTPGRAMIDAMRQRAPRKVMLD